MIRNTTKRWRPRFSLKAFLVFCLLCGVAVAWVSQNYRDYRAEQRLIEVFTNGLRSDSVMSIATNGETWFIGDALM